MSLLAQLKAEAVRRGFLQPGADVTLETAFLLVRDMPYIRASSREPETLIGEWRGTCSGKHYLLKELYAELGYKAQVMACTSVTRIDPQTVPPPLHSLLAQSKGRFVDVHNYLLLELPEGTMIIDATWPLATTGSGTVVNEAFVLGQDQALAAEPLQTWVVPSDRDPQAFKDELLRTHFSEEELAQRDAFILAIGELGKRG